MSRISVPLFMLGLTFTSSVSLAGQSDCRLNELKAGTVFGMSAPLMDWTTTNFVASDGDVGVTAPVFTDPSWTTNHVGLTQCAKNENGIIIDVKMLGGYNLLGGDVYGNQAFLEKTLPNLPAGDYVISFDFYHLDNWQGEQAYLQTKSGTFGYQNRWSRNHTSGGNDGTQNVCGNDNYWDYAGLTQPKVTVTVNHAQNGPFTLRFGTTLSNGANAASWGINNIKVVQTGTSKTISDDRFPNFEGWGPEKKTNTCSAITDPYLGGANSSFGAGAEATVAMELPPGNYTAEFNFFAFDSWDGEVGYLKYNNTYVWQRAHRYDLTAGENQCGRSFDDKTGILNAPEKAFFVHEGGPFTLTFGSTLNEPSFNESWGINNLVVKQSPSTSCAGRTMWGGYQVCGVGCTATKTLTDLVPGVYFVSFDYFHVDSWEDEIGWFQFNDREVWSRKHFSGNATQNICGRGGAFNDDGIFLERAVVKVIHTGGDAVLRWGSNLDEPAVNESWGIDNIRVDRDVAGVLRHRYNWQDNQPYFWRVRAESGGNEGPWSQVQEFLIDTGKPKPFNLLTPTSGTDPDTKTPTLTWEPALNQDVGKGCLAISGGVCNSDADCLGTCTNGVCSEDTAEFTCTEDSQCAGTCTNGVCSEHTACTSDSDCNGQCGSNGYCTDLCKANNECATDRVCIQGTCTTTGGAGSACDEKADCASGLDCTNDVCVTVSGFGLMATSAGTARLTKTSTSSSHDKKWTLSYWAKRANAAASKEILLGAKGATAADFLRVGFNNDRATFEYSTAAGTQNCTQTTSLPLLGADNNSWHHYVWALDTGADAANRRLRLYIDGQERTGWLSGFGPCLVQNQAIGHWGASGVAQTVAADPSNTQNFDGLLAQVYFIDGKNYEPTEFGLLQEQRWVPAVFSGSYGSNGYLLDFSNTYNFGIDRSGNANHFVSTNFQAHHALLDTPETDFAIFDLSRHQANGLSLAASNLHVSKSSGSGLNAVGTHLSTGNGRYYYEFKVVSSQPNSQTPVLGVANTSLDFTSLVTMGPSWTQSDSQIYGVESKSAQNQSLLFGNGDVVGVAVALDFGAMWFHVNGSWQNGASASSASNFDATTAYQVGFTGEHTAALLLAAGNDLAANFGQDPTFGGRSIGGNRYAPENGVGRFLYPVPPGYLAFARTNLGRQTLKACSNNDQCEDICLVETAGGTTFNLEVDATVTASSIYSGWPVSNLFDGDASTAWRSDPVSGQEMPVITVDLGKPVHLKQIRVRGVSSSYGSQHILATASPDNNLSVQRNAAFSSANNSDWLTLNFNGALSRYLRIVSISNFSTTAGLSELEVVLDDEGYCASRQESGGSCDEHFDCKAGLECVGGLCQNEPQLVRKSSLLDQSAQSSFQRTLDRAGDSKTWSFSTWFKRGATTATDQVLFDASLDANNTVSLALGGSSGACANRFSVSASVSGTDYQWCFLGAQTGQTDWAHVLVTVDTANRLGENNRPRLFVSGVEVLDYDATGGASGGFAADDQLALGQVGTRIFLGSGSDNTRHFDGYLAELQLIDGTAVQLADVTDNSAQLAPQKFAGDFGTTGFYLPMNARDNGSSHLSKLHLRGTANGTTLDNSSSAHAVTTYGSSAYKVGAGNPFDSNGNAIYFDGSTAYLEIPDSNDFALGVNAFTLDFWVYLPQTGDSFELTQQLDALNYTNVKVSETGISFHSVGGTGGVPYSVTDAGTVTAGQWTHVAIQRNPSLFALYIDGRDVTAQGTASAAFNNQNFGDQNGPLKIGRGPLDEYSKAYIFDLRLVKNDNTFFVNNFTPPSAPLPFVNLGQDFSGNDNHMGAVNITAANMVLDHPAQNFAVWSTSTNSKGALSVGNLSLVKDGLMNNSSQATFGRTQGQWYYELLLTEVGGASSEFQVGLRSDSNQIKSLVSVGGTELVYDNYGTINQVSSNLGVPTTPVQSRAPAWHAKDVVGVAFDVDNDSIQFYLNGVLVKRITYAGLTGGEWAPWAFNDDNNYSWRANFGQDPTFGGALSRSYYFADSQNFGRFYHQPPAGYLPLSAESGCLVDTDGDGTKDCFDQCPNDAALVAKGPCGCAPCLTADKCYAVRDSGFDSGEASSFTAATGNAESPGPVALNAHWWAFGQDTDSALGVCNNIDVSVTGGVGVANHTGAAETECRALLYQCVTVPDFNATTQRLRLSFDQQVTGTTADEIPAVLIGSSCETTAPTSYAADWWPNFGGNTLFSHFEKPTSLTSFDYNVSTQLAAHKGQKVMIAVSTFDQGANTATNVIDNLQLRVDGPGCEGVLATDDTDGDGIIDLLDGAPENANLQVDLPVGLRFNNTGTASTSANLSQTFANAGDRQKATVSFWVRSNNVPGGLVTLGASGGGGSQSEFDIRFSANNVLRISDSVNNAAVWSLETDDTYFTSSTTYFHVTVAVDTTLSVASDRVKVWVNGLRRELNSGLSSATYPSENHQNQFGLANTLARVGARDGSGSPYQPLAGYLSEVYYVDGAARDANDFAGFNEAGNWAPKAYDMASEIGNSFHLRFQSPTTTMSPSVSGAAFLSDGDTKTLIHSNHAGGANWQTLVDESSTYSWTAYGDAGHSTDESHFGNSSIEFDGSGDYLKASGSWWHLRGNWNGDARTIEMWFNTDSNAFQALASQSANQHYQYLWIKPGCSGSEDCIGIGGNQGGTHAKGKATITLNTWHHVAHVITADSQSYIFFNGELIDHRSWTNPTGFAGAEHMQIGAQTYYGTSNHRFPFSGYIDEIRYSLTARYLPNAVSGIGADSSPRGNHFTAYNLDAHDVTLDSPLTSFATMNPATTGVVSGSITFSEGNTKVSSSQAYNKIFTTHSATSGKYYAEAMVHSNGFQYMGVAPEAYVANVDDFTGYLTQNNSHVWALYNSDSGTDGKVYHNGVAQEDLGSIGSYTVIHIALDVDNLKVYFGMNGTWSGDPVAGTGGHAISDDRWYFAQGYRDSVTWNFGQDPTFAGEKSGQSNAPTEGPGRFYYQPPAGYGALVDVNY